MERKDLTNVDFKTLLSGPLAGRCSAPGCSFVGDLGVRYARSGLSFGTCNADCWNVHFAREFGSLENLSDAPANPPPSDFGPRFCDFCGKPITRYLIPAEREFCSAKCVAYFHGSAPILSIDSAASDSNFASDAAGYRSQAKIKRGPAPIEKLLLDRVEPAPEPVGPDSFGGSDFPESLTGTIFALDQAGEPAFPSDPDPDDCAFCERPIDPRIVYAVGESRVCSANCSRRLHTANAESDRREKQRVERYNAAAVRIVANWNCVGGAFTDRRNKLRALWPMLANDIAELFEASK